MHYYERHLGDYAKDTAHLSMLEHGAYCLLLDRYYTTEAGIPAEQAHRIARARTREEKQAVDAVLAEFFHLVDGVWINRRAEEEITKARARIRAARENGKKGGRPKKIVDETQNKPSGLSLGYPRETQPQTQTKAHHTPYIDTPNISQTSKGIDTLVPPITGSGTQFLTKVLIPESRAETLPKIDDASQTTSAGTAPPPATRQTPKSESIGPRGTRLPTDWTLPSDWEAWAMRERPSWSRDYVHVIAESFRDYWIAKAGEGARKVDWFATWRNWIRRQTHENPRRETTAGYSSRESRINNYAAQAAAARGEHGSERTIDGEAIRIA